MHLLYRLLVALCAVALAAAAQPGASPEGRWLTEKKHGIVEVYRCGGDGTLCGRLVWFQIEPGSSNPQGIDLHNPDPARRLPWTPAFAGVTGSVLTLPSKR